MRKFSNGVNPKELRVRNRPCGLQHEWVRHIGSAAFEESMTGNFWLPEKTPYQTIQFRLISTNNLQLIQLEPSNFQTCSKPLLIFIHMMMKISQQNHSLNPTKWSQSAEHLHGPASDLRFGDLQGILSSQGHDRALTFK
jgi:hypothetical protein